jgi:hypothetical protein
LRPIESGITIAIGREHKRAAVRAPRRLAIPCRTRRDLDPAGAVAFGPLYPDVTFDCECKPTVRAIRGVLDAGGEAGRRDGGLEDEQQCSER